MKRFGVVLGLLMMMAINTNAQQYKVVFNVYYDTTNGNYEVFIMDIDGKNRKNISNYRGTDWVYRTYKDKIYFISDRDTSCPRCYKLYVTDVEGSPIRKVSDLVLEDSWMDTRNNGSEMIVSARKGREIRAQLFLLNLMDGSYHQLTTDTSAYYNDPVFSPDGKQVVFRYRKEKRNRFAKTELYIMNSDGTGMRQLSFYPAGDSSIKSGEYHAGPPRWNSKENYISYMSFQKGKYQVYAITPDGKKQWQITNEAMESGWHDWTPDGKWMVTELSTPAKKIFDIYLMNTKTKEFIRLTDDWRYEQAPSFVEIKN